jgi:hypothetical protein
MKRSSQAPIYQFFKKPAMDVNSDTKNNKSPVLVQPPSVQPSLILPSVPTVSIQTSASQPPLTQHEELNFKVENIDPATPAVQLLSTKKASSQPSSIQLPTIEPLSSNQLTVDQKLLTQQETLTNARIIDPATLAYSSADPKDIGHYINRVRELDDSTKFDIIKASWQPPSTYKFAFSIHNKRNQEEKRYVNHNHLKNNEWLVYSDIYKGLFCKYCVVFAEFYGPQKIKIEKFVLKPLTRFARLTGKEGDLKIHENTNYHRNSVVTAEGFCKVFQDPSKSIVNLLKAQRHPRYSKTTQMPVKSE